MSGTPLDRATAERVLAAAGLADVADGLIAPCVWIHAVTSHPPGHHPVPEGDEPCPECLRARPSPVNGLPSKVTAVAAGWRHALALLDDGSVFAWGTNDCGQVGDGSTRLRRAPVHVPGLSTAVVSVAAGNHHSAAVTADGTVLVWGFGGQGGLGLGDLQGRVRPTPVPLPGPASAVLAAAHRTVVLLRDGTVMSWGGGYPNNGLIGDGGTESRPTPVRVVGLTDVHRLAVGPETTFAMRGDGTVWGWGSNDDGQLGDGTTEHRPTPVQVMAHHQPPVMIAAGRWHTVVLGADGAVVTWEDSANGQPEVGTKVPAVVQPRPVELAEPAISVAAGWRTTWIVLTSGRVVGFGANHDGSVGDGTLEDREQPVETSPSLSGVSTIAGQWDLVVACTNDGRVFQWGGHEPAPTGGREQAALGSTKLGGRPDLPVAVGWPEFDGLPQAFVAQVALDDGRGLDGSAVLPESGLLSFFFAQSYPSGMEPGERGAWAVLLTPDTSALERREYPDGVADGWRFPETPAVLQSAATLADPGVPRHRGPGTGRGAAPSL